MHLAGVELHAAPVGLHQQRAGVRRCPPPSPRRRSSAPAGHVARRGRARPRAPTRPLPPAARPGSARAPPAPPRPAPRRPRRSAGTSRSRATPPGSPPPQPRCSGPRRSPPSPPAAGPRQDARDLAAVDPDVVRPLDRALDRRERLARLAHGHGGRERQQRVPLVEVAHDEGGQQRATGRRDPRAALAAATGGLLVGGDERAVRRAGARQRASPARWSSRSAGGGPAGRRSPSAQRDPVVVGRGAGAGGVAAVDGERQRAVGVLVDEELARGHVGEGAATSAPGSARRRPRPRSARPSRRPAAGQVAVARRSGRRCRSRRPRARARRARPRRSAAARQLEHGELVGVDRARPRRRARPGRERGGHRREDVAAVEGGRHRLEPVRRAGDVDRLDDPAADAPRPGSARRCRGRPGAGPSAQRSATARRSVPTCGSTTATCTPERQVGDRVAQHDRARADRVTRDPVRDVDDARVRGAPAITPWQTPTNSSCARSR